MLSPRRRYLVKDLAHILPASIFRHRSVRWLFENPLSQGGLLHGSPKPAQLHPQLRRDCKCAASPSWGRYRSVNSRRQNRASRPPWQRRTALSCLPNGLEMSRGAFFAPSAPFPCWAAFVTASADIYLALSTYTNSLGAGGAEVGDCPARAGRYRP